MFHAAQQICRFTRQCAKEADACERFCVFSWLVPQRIGKHEKTRKRNKEAFLIFSNAWSFFCSLHVYIHITSILKTISFCTANSCPLRSGASKTNRNSVSVITNCRSLPPDGVRWRQRQFRSSNIAIVAQPVWPTFIPTDKKHVLSHEGSLYSCNVVIHQCALFTRQSLLSRFVSVIIWNVIPEKTPTQDAPRRPIPLPVLQSLSQGTQEHRVWHGCDWSLHDLLPDCCKYCTRIWVQTKCRHLDRSYGKWSWTFFWPDGSRVCTAMHAGKQGRHAFSHTDARKTSQATLSLSLPELLFSSFSLWLLAVPRWLTKGKRIKHWWIYFKRISCVQSAPAIKENDNLRALLFLVNFQGKNPPPS